MKEQNKWIKWLLIAIVLLSLFTSVTYAQSPALTITDYIVQPEILTPGELGTVTVTIKNSAVNTSADITDIYLFAPRFKHDHKRFDYDSNYHFLWAISNPWYNKTTAHNPEHNQFNCCFIYCLTYPFKENSKGEYTKSNLELKCFTGLVYLTHQQQVGYL